MNWYEHAGKHGPGVDSNTSPVPRNELSHHTPLRLTRRPEAGWALPALRSSLPSLLPSRTLIPPKLYFK